MSEKKVTLEDLVELVSNIEQKVGENAEELNERLDEIIEKLDNIGLPGSDYGVIDT